MNTESEQPKLRTGLPIRTPVSKRKIRCMLSAFIYCVPLLCWPNYGMRYLRPNRFTMMLVCGKLMSGRFWSLMEVQHFWPQVHSRGPISDSSVHCPFDEVLTIANRWRWFIVKAMVIWTGHRSFKLQRADLTCDVTSFRLRWFEPRPIREEYSNFAGV